MSVLYNQFCITDIVTDLKTKTIVIATNFKVDSTTINLNTVSLYDYSAGNGQLAEYDLHVDGKDICIILKDFPPAGTKYYLKVTEIYDALNRQINYSYNDYIKFNDNEIITDVEIISPGYRETISQNSVDIKLKIADPLTTGQYRVQISSDNAFFKTVATLSKSATADEIGKCDSDIVTITNSDIKDGVLEFKTSINYNGQLYIRARAERSDSDVGKWSELSTFTMYLVPADSLETTFLENSLTTFDLFPDEGAMDLLEINDKSNIANASDKLLYIEFNKEIKLPEDYELDKNGYVSLGMVTGFRKELK